MLTIYYTTLIVLALALFVVWALDRLEVDLPGVARWAAKRGAWIGGGLAVLAVLPALWRLGDWVALLLMGGAAAGSEGARRMRGGSELPGREPVDDVEPSHEASEQVGGAAGAVEGDGLAGDLADEMREGAGELEESRSGGQQN